MRERDIVRLTEAARVTAALAADGDEARRIRKQYRLRRLAGLPDGRSSPARGRVRRANRVELPPGQDGAGMIGTREAARRLGVSPAYVRTLVQRERIAWYKPRGRLLFDPVEVERLRQCRGETGIVPENGETG